MGRIELTIAVAGVLLAFLIVGWFGHVVFSRLVAKISSRDDRANELALELLAVEEDRDRRITEAVAREARLRGEAKEERERLEALLREREAELSAAMDGLRMARAQSGM